MMAPAVASDADCVIFDLEDAVAEENIPAARDNLVENLPDIDTEETEISVRINGTKTDYWLEDVRTASSVGVDTLHVPEVEHPWQIRLIVETAAQSFETPPELILLIESPNGLLRGNDIATECRNQPTVTGIAFGMSDYAISIGGSQTSSQIREFLNHQILAIAAAGNLNPISSVYPDARDIDGLREIAEAAAELGFIGQTVIHPDQVAPINEIFTPEPEAVDRARKLLRGFERAEGASVEVDGVFMDEAHVARYENVVRRFEYIEGEDAS
jgi:citrate lyase subunit beta/citryl-CoA lyase